MLAHPPWDFPRSPAAVRDLLHVAVARGVGEATVLKGTGIDAGALQDPTLLIEAEQELRAIRNLIFEVGDWPGLGLEAGQHFSVGSAGVLGFALLSSPTAREATRIAVRYSTLTPAYADLRLEESADGAVFLYDVTDVPDDVAVFLLERDLAALANVLDLVAGPMLAQAACRIELALDQERSALVAGLFPPSFEVLGSQPRTAITLPAGVLELPLPQADPHMAAVCAQQCEELVERRRSRRGIGAQVRVLLLRSPAEMPELPDVAAELALSGRTLHRRLADEGTSFRDLRNEVREALATEMLTRAGLTVEEVSRRLGYSEAAAFSRAYKSWTSTNPSQMVR